MQTSATAGEEAIGKRREFEGLEHQVIITELPAMKAGRLAVRISRILGPALGRAVQGLDLEGASSLDALLESVNFKSVGEGLELLFDKLTEDEFEGITRALLQPALYGGKPLMPMFDVVFKGKFITMLKVIGFAFEAQYGDFSGAAGDVVERFKAAMSPSSGTSPEKLSSSGAAGG